MLNESAFFWVVFTLGWVVAGVRYGVRKGRSDIIESLADLSLDDGSVCHRGVSYRVMRKPHADALDGVWSRVSEANTELRDMAEKYDKLEAAYHNQQTDLDVARAAVLAADDRAAKATAERDAARDELGGWVDDYNRLKEVAKRSMDEKAAAEAEANDATTAYLQAVEVIKGIGRHVATEVLLATSFTNTPQANLSPAVVEAGVPFLAPGWPDDAEGGSND